MDLKIFTSLQNSDTDRIFTGVGSRKTPENMGLLMAGISRKLTQVGWTLRSGGANGADLAFESGVNLPERKEIYLPYPGFNGSESRLSKLAPACFEVASKVHPAWERCSDFAKKAHARNAFQVLGYNLMRPADALICWTQDGAIDAASAKNAGGTRTAIVLAEMSGVPVFNLQHPGVAEQFRLWVGEALLAQVKPELRMHSISKPRLESLSNHRAEQAAQSPEYASAPGVQADGSPGGGLVDAMKPRFRFRAPSR